MPSLTYMFFHDIIWLMEKKKMSFYDAIRELTKRYRAHKGTSQAELGKLLSVSQTAIASFEKGSRTLRVEAMESLIDLLREWYPQVDSPLLRADPSLQAFLPLFVDKELCLEDLDPDLSTSIPLDTSDPVALLGADLITLGQVLKSPNYSQQYKTRKFTAWVKLAYENLADLAGVIEKSHFDS